MAAPDKQFRAVWVSKVGRAAYRWGRWCGSPSEAKRQGKAEVDAGRASTAYVVELAGGVMRPLPQYTYPEAHRKIIMHWEGLLDLTEPTPGAEETTP